jgi:hypothetical protein
MMGHFRVFLIGVPQPLLVDLPVESASELVELALRARFLEAHMVEADSDGVCASVLLPTGRLQLVIEAN